MPDFLGDICLLNQRPGYQRIVAVFETWRTTANFKRTRIRTFFYV